MRFLALSPVGPAALLAAAAAVVVALYLLKPPPRRIVVPSHLLWLRVLRERKSRSDTLRWWLSLLLALSIGLALALGLARPEVESLAGRVRRIAVVIDNGPTMATRCRDGRTRFDHALEWGRRLLAEGSAGSEFMVADTAGRIRSPRLAERTTALETLARLTGSADARVEFPRLELQDVEPYFVSDGVLVEDWPAETRVISVFEPAANAGITGFGIRPLPADPGKYEASVEVVSHLAEPREMSLLMSGAGRHRAERSLRLQPGQVLAETFDLGQFASGPLRVSLSAAGDALELDDVAFSYLPEVTRVVMVSAGNAFLENVLRADRSVELTVLRPTEWDGEVRADVYVFDRYVPSTPPAAPALLFAPPPAPWLSGTEILPLSPAHPLLKDMDLDELAVGRATSTPLMAFSESPSRTVRVGFDLADSNFPLLPGFAIFVTHAVSWLSEGSMPIPRQLRWVEVPIAAAAVSGLDGKEWPTVRSEGRAFFEAAAPGLYTAADGKRRVRLAVNLTSPRVSDVSRSRFAGREAPALPGEEPSGGPELWVLLLGASAFLLMLEWWTFHRRLTV